MRFASALLIRSDSLSLPTSCKEDWQEPEIKFKNEEFPIYIS